MPLMKPDMETSNKDWKSIIPKWKCPRCLLWVREPIGKACLTCKLAEIELKALGE